MFCSHLRSQRHCQRICAVESEYKLLSTDRIHSTYQPTNALNKIQFMTTVNLLHVLKQGCHIQGVYEHQGLLQNSTKGKIFIIISIQPLGLFWREPEPSQATGMDLVRWILGKFLGVVCHCFPLPLDVPTLRRQMPPHPHQRERS
jgi:hypothetical protein